MRKILIALTVLLALAMAAPDGAHAGEKPAPDGMPVLTIAGKVGNFNRGPAERFPDGLLKFYEFEFKRAMMFDRRMLAALRQDEIVIDGEKWTQAVRLRGARLDDVLAAAGVRKGKKAVFYGLDGYNVEIPLKELRKGRWVAGLELDGQPLAIGGRGPVWVAFDTKGAKASEEEMAKWPWAVFYIEIQ